MKVKVLSRPLSRAEGFNFISDYFRSGMSASEYYRSHDISEWQFYKWRKLYLLEHPELDSVSQSPRSSSKVSKAIPRFASLEIKDAPSSSSACFPSIEIQYPNGTLVRIGEGLQDTSFLNGLITLALGTSCSR